MWLFKKKPQETMQALPMTRAVPAPQPQPIQHDFSAPEPKAAVMSAVREAVTQPMGFSIPEPPQPQQQQTSYDFPVEQQQPEPNAEWEPAMPETAEIPVALGSMPSATEVEEVVEAVIEEKWKQLEFRIDAIEKRFDSVNERLHDVDLQMRTLKESGTVASGGIEGKIEQYKENLSQIDARIGSIEKAFKETLPSMIESVRSVNDSLQKLGNK